MERPIVDRKAKMKLPHIPQPVRPALERIHDFDEVALGYDAAAAIAEAERCIQCPEAKCQDVCPLGNDIPGAMWLISQGDFLGAANRYRETSIFPEICGRVCPQERLCEGACVLGKRGAPAALGALERFVTDYQRQTEGWPLPELAPPTGRLIAVVGSGPAGLAVAEELTKRGHEVVVYEAWPEPGGLLLYGIPSFKLPKHLVEEKINFLMRLGVRFMTNTRIGESLSVDDLFAAGFDAVFLGTGANVDAKLKAEGVELAGVSQATDFLVRTNVDPHLLPEHMRQPVEVGEKVVVIGGGDTAMDCLRSALRLGAKEVACLYRRTEAEMPGSKKERVYAIDEGVRFEYLVAPVRFIGDEAGHVRQIECQRMALGEPDKSGRPRPIPIEGSNFLVDADSVILALGYWPDPLLSETTPGLETHDWGLITAKTETGATSRPGVFAGGDNVTGPDLVSTAVAAGLRAVRAIDEYLRIEDRRLKIA
jgi:glutamate synthase (NADPH/NADH) small chain